MNGLPLVFGSAALLAAVSARRGSRGRSRVGDTVWLLIKEWRGDRGGETAGVGVHVSSESAWDELIHDWQEASEGFPDEDEEWREWRNLRSRSERIAFIDECPDQPDWVGYWFEINPTVVQGPPSIRDLKGGKR
jgi:hypothetical protein